MTSTTEQDGSKDTEALAQALALKGQDLQPHGEATAEVAQGNDCQQLPGPTIREFEAEGKKVPDTVCTVCPLGMWRIEGGLNCYCRLMHRDSYQLKRPLVLIRRCDGPFLAADD